MTTITDDQEREKRLLSAEEQAMLMEIALQKSPYRPRAQALLAIDEGATQVGASHQTGLTPGQVRYWLNKFRNGRMSVFQGALPDTTKVKKVRSSQVTVEPPTSPDIPDLQQIDDVLEVQEDTADEAQTGSPVGEAPARQEASPKTKKKLKKSKKSKKSKKEKKRGKPKKNSKKKTAKKKKSKKAKNPKGASVLKGKKKKKKRKNAP